MHSWIAFGWTERAFFVVFRWIHITSAHLYRKSTDFLQKNIFSSKSHFFFNSTQYLHENRKSSSQHNNFKFIHFFLQKYKTGFSPIFEFLNLIYSSSTYSSWWRSNCWCTRRNEKRPHLPTNMNELWTGCCNFRTLDKLNLGCDCADYFKYKYCKHNQDSRWNIV